MYPVAILLRVRGVREKSNFGDFALKKLELRLHYCALLLSFLPNK